VTADADPRDELLAVLDGLTDDQVRTLVAWTGTLRRGPVTSKPGRSLGSLGELLGIVPDIVEPGRSRMRLNVDRAWLNPNGSLHGAVIYAMVDYGMGGAAQVGLPAGQYCATIEVKISYLAPVWEGTLTVDTEVVKRGRNIAFTESKVRDGKGRLVVTASGSMFIIRPDPKQ
jgi:acyl-CoA thioesterase